MARLEKAAVVRDLSPSAVAVVVERGPVYLMRGGRHFVLDHREREALRKLLAHEEVVGDGVGE